MARKAEFNGPTDTLQRLFGHDDDRSLLAKLAGKNPLKNHRMNPDKSSNVFKRSTACDNLIKNLLALDAVFNSQDLVCALAERKVPPAVVHEEIERARGRLGQKLRAYSYWYDRLDSLEALLKEQPSLEEFALEDHLAMNGKTNAMGTPYALRAVQLLERVEEEGRNSLLSPDQLNEKAWALYRLGLSDQAVTVARQAVESDSEHSEAWMLLAIHHIHQKRAADQAVAHYEFQKEEADPMSGQETWAEEMRSQAEDQRAKALADHRAVVFPALLHWPCDQGNPYRGYRYRERYEQVRNWCIDWLFAFTQPECQNPSARADWLNVIEPQASVSSICWKEQPQKHYDRWIGEAGSTRRLSALETQVAKSLCREWGELVAKGSEHAFFQRSLLEPSVNLQRLRLKLLHIYFVLGLPGYEQVRKLFLGDLRLCRWDELSAILNQAALFHTLTLHCSTAGLDELVCRFDGLARQVNQEHRENYSLLQLNLMRQIYHQAFARAEFGRAMSVAQEAQAFLEQELGFEPKELSMDVSQSNTLSLKHWKYLELRAAVEIGTESVDAQKALLQVANPADYFADESAYLVNEIVDYEFGEEWYVAPYGDSIITSGRWLEVVKKILDDGAYADLEMDSKARGLVAQLAPLVIEQLDSRNLADYWNEPVVEGTAGD